MCYSYLQFLEAGLFFNDCAATWIKAPVPWRRPSEEAYPRAVHLESFDDCDQNPEPPEDGGMRRGCAAALVRPCRIS